MKKSCGCCKATKDGSEFPKNKNSKDGLYSYCKQCVSERRKRDYDPAKAKARYQRKREELLEQKKVYYAAKKEEIRSRRQKYRDENREKVRQQTREFYEKNKAKRRADAMRQYHKNRERRLVVMRQWAAKNMEYKKDYNRKYRPVLNARCRHRLQFDLQFRIANRLRCRLYQSIKRRRLKKACSFTKALGCTMEFLIAYLESMFEPGMTWDNWALDGWHIDHIRPLASFDLSDKEQFREACHYTNLQPLWAAENLSKGDRVTAVHYPRNAAG